jgi:hypothetical protein
MAVSTTTSPCTWQELLQVPRLLASIALHLRLRDILHLALCNRTLAQAFALLRPSSHAAVQHRHVEAERFWYQYCCIHFDCQAAFTTEIDWLAHTKIIQRFVVRYQDFIRLVDNDTESTEATGACSNLIRFATLLTPQLNRVGNTVLHSLIIEAGILNERVRLKKLQQQQQPEQQQQSEQQQSESIESTTTLTLPQAIEELQHILVNLGLSSDTTSHHTLLTTPNSQQQYPIHIAARSGLLEIVKQLLACMHSDVLQTQDAGV